MTLCSADIKTGLVDTASMQAGLPVVHRQEGAEALDKLPGSSADAIVMLGGLQSVAERTSYFANVSRVLKPGGRCAPHPLVVQLRLRRRSP